MKLSLAVLSVLAAVSCGETSEQNSTKPDFSAFLSEHPPEILTATKAGEILKVRVKKPSQYWDVSVISIAKAYNKESLVYQSKDKLESCTIEVCIMGIELPPSLSKRDYWISSILFKDSRVSPETGLISAPQPADGQFITSGNSFYSSTNIEPLTFTLEAGVSPDNEHPQISNVVIDMDSYSMTLDVTDNRTMIERIDVTLNGKYRGSDYERTQVGFDEIDIPLNGRPIELDFSWANDGKGLEKATVHKIIVLDQGNNATILNEDGTLSFQ